VLSRRGWADFSAMAGAKFAGSPSNGFKAVGGCCKGRPLPRRSILHCRFEIHSPKPFRHGFAGNCEHPMKFAAVMPRLEGVKVIALFAPTGLPST